MSILKVMWSISVILDIWRCKMKNKPYPLYSLPKIRDLKDMVKKRAENTPDEVAFSLQ